MFNFVFILKCTYITSQVKIKNKQFNYKQEKKLTHLVSAIY